MDKQKIKESFSKSAKTYDKYADIQKTMAEKLVFQISGNYKNILDVGCGTGLLEEFLIKKYPYSEITGIDIASQMVEIASKKFDNIKFLLADGESLPFSDSEFDLVVSSASIQWMDTQKVFSEAHRVLKPKGMFYFSTFGPKTLKELKEIGLSVNKFPTKEELYEILRRHFKHIEITDELISKNYKDIFEVFAYLKAIGAQNPQKVTSKGLLTWKRLASMLQKNPNITYEVIVGKCC